MKPEFQTTNAPSVDAFFQSVQSFSDKWEAGISPIMDAKGKFLTKSTFEMEPNQKIGIGIIGLLLYFSTGLSGEEKVDFEVTDEEPYFKILPPPKIADGQELVEALIDYVKGLISFAKDTLPGLQSEIEGLVAASAGIVAGVQDEAMSLSPMDKVRAPIKTVKNVALLKDLAAEFKKRGAEITKEISDLKSSLKDIKETTSSAKYTEGKKKL